MSKRIHVATSKLHKWLALIIGAQMLLWFVSGSVMSILPIETVRSEHLVSRDAAPIGEIENLMAPAILAAQINGGIGSLRYRMILGAPVAEVVDNKGVTYLFNAQNGELRGPVSAAEAKRIAAGAWIDGEPQIEKVERIRSGSVEYRGDLPAWRVSTTDDVRIYMPVATGEIKAVRSTTWRVFDFFWSLHIMDWVNHEDFNSWWLIAFALGGVFMAISGLTLLVKRWPIKRKKRPAIS